MSLSIRTKRLLVVMALMGLVVLGAVGYFAHLLTRDVPFDWENPNFVESNEAKRKLKLYSSSLAAGERGFVRLSQLEINSYLMSLSTNKTTNAASPAPLAPAEGPGTKLRRIGIALNNTNFVVYSWAESDLFGWPVRFVVQRGFQIQQSDEKPWELNQQFMHVGEVEIPQEYWPKFERTVGILDEPLLKEFNWTTNIQAMLVRRNELSQRPELRLYNYKPIPSGDLR